MTRKEFKEKAQDEIMHHAKNAWRFAYENESQEMQDEIKKQLERIAKFLGYEDLGPF